MTRLPLPSDEQSGTGRVFLFPDRSGREPWWPKKKLAQYLDVSERTIERWTAEGMPCLRSRRTVRYRVSDVEAWLSSAEA
jgi:excisionase family DNA binding protein